MCTNLAVGGMEVGKGEPEGVLRMLDNEIDVLFFLETKMRKIDMREQLIKLRPCLQQPIKNLLRIFLEGMTGCIVAVLYTVSLRLY